MYVAKVLEKHDEKMYRLMEKVGLDGLLGLEKPFTVFVSAKYLLDRFKRVEQNYLTSVYGKDDLKHLLEYVIVPEAILFDGHSTGESTCKSK